MAPGLTLSRSRHPDDVRAARDLRHLVFVGEMGADRDGDPFDDRSEHLILRDATRPDLGAVATVRIGREAAYTAQEFDLTPLRRGGRRLADVGRVCLHPDYRGGLAVLSLFRGVLSVLRDIGADIAVGTASFPGATPDLHMPGLRRLRTEALAPPQLRPVAVGPGAIPVAGEAPRRAMRDVPGLIKTYLRAGAWVGDGAYVDRTFNTTDVCMVLDLSRATVPGTTR